MSGFPILSAIQHIQNAQNGISSTVQSLTSTINDSAQSVIQMNYAGVNALNSAVVAGALSAKAQCDKIQPTRFISDSTDVTAEFVGKVNVSIIHLTSNSKDAALLIAQRVWSNIHLKTILDETIQWIRDNPKTAVAIGVGIALVGVGGCLLMPVLVNPAGLTAVGVGAVGTLTSTIISVFYAESIGLLSVYAPMLAPASLAILSKSCSGAIWAVRLAQNAHTAIEIGKFIYRRLPHSVYPSESTESTENTESTEGHRLLENMG